MDLQLLIVALLILGAFTLVGRAAWRRSRSFTVKSGCETDCGCGGKSKKASV
ncbi:MAG: hypothetical protein ABI791_03220 [Acidobacteriota bacterium]